MELNEQMKDSVINEVSELISEVKTSKEVDTQFDFKVSKEGEHIILSSSFSRANHLFTPKSVLRWK